MAKVYAESKTMEGRSIENRLVWGITRSWKSVYYNKLLFKQSPQWRYCRKWKLFEFSSYKQCCVAILTYKYIEGRICGAFIKVLSLAPFQRTLFNTPRWSVAGRGKEYFYPPYPLPTFTKAHRIFSSRSRENKAVQCYYIIIFLFFFKYLWP